MMSKTLIVAAVLAVALSACNNETAAPANTPSQTAPAPAASPTPDTAPTPAPTPAPETAPADSAPASGGTTTPAS
ncbi:endopeptidase [Bordetella avium]|uniref:hypothetical protein n=1 Tax=Bordetella avium TaxID=521 RepID=UPI0002D55029|nr:hypothetical protein [Bordetella avium]AZY49942.1 endopeptidase [Bordetella avium]AZY53309.1 endopeptidase [Bordetella avium]RIQ17298.1 endopeptidase [Bordetella avium]RIQ33783.1 endopeptidase [Bordetella avium]RIQ51975.1 endopeptidase [Bordetella avium]